MSFLIECPNCGSRDSAEFRYGGELRPRAVQLDDDRCWADYIFGRENASGDQQEWWYHRLGCCRWFIAVRNLSTNRISRTEWFAVEPKEHQS